MRPARTILIMQLSNSRVIGAGAVWETGMYMAPDV